MQDRCIKRYAAFYGSDDRIHACMSEVGVPLTKEPGFRQAMPSTLEQLQVATLANYYLSSAFYDNVRNRTASEYVIHQGPNSDCNWDMPNPALISESRFIRNLTSIYGTR
ncbi:hypothetical protein K2173_013282 [Erythroxylum novogranatense]|uniref:Uncharacterized protein n=1 Tax=Erythroxylum novogranatense TaxID=1862640 RepID=A0AAV8S9G8_9ROSI|nr:hypothetical protein K2173_013282 [Erythroxylum novogranatense]